VLFDRNTPTVTLLQRDFLLVDPLETGLFDAVLMNPPFKNGSDIRHVRHAIRFLRPGGRLASFCYDGPRQAEVLKPLALNSGGIWEPLGPGAFRSSNTNASTVILTINSEN